MAVITQDLIGEYTFSFDDSGATRILTLAADLGDDATVQANRQEFRDLPGNVVRAIQEKVVEFMKDGTVSNIEMDLDLDDYGPWDHKINQIFLFAFHGFRIDGMMFGNGKVGSVREWRISK